MGAARPRPRPPLHRRRLATAREWSESHPGELTPAEVDFLAAGISAERKKKDDEVERSAPGEAEPRTARPSSARTHPQPARSS